LPTLSAKLTVEYGRGWNERNVANMLRFIATFPDQRIVSARMRQLCDTVARITIQCAELFPEERIASLIRQLNIAKYLTDSLQKEVPPEKLRIAIARKRLENQGKEGIAEDMAKLLEGE